MRCLSPLAADQREVVDFHGLPATGNSDLGFASRYGDVFQRHVAPARARRDGYLLIRASTADVQLGAGRAALGPNR